MNLFDIMQSAQGGQGVNNLAQQFGLSHQQALAALQAMLPAFSTGLQRTAQDPMGIGALFAQMANGANAGAYVDPSRASAAAPLGGAFLGQIFGSPQMAQQVGQQASMMSGVNPQVIQQMMPIVAAMLMGGLAQAMAAQGMGNWFSQFSQGFPQPPQNTAGSPDAILGNWMQSMNTVFGGMMPNPAAPQASPQASAMQAGMNTLNSLLQAGVQISEAQQKSMNDILQSISDAAKG